MPRPSTPLPPIKGRPSASHDPSSLSHAAAAAHHTHRTSTNISTRALQRAQGQLPPMKTTGTTDTQLTTTENVGAQQVSNPLTGNPLEATRISQQLAQSFHKYLENDWSTDEQKKENLNFWLRKTLQTTEAYFSLDGKRLAREVKKFKGEVKGIKEDVEKLIEEGGLDAEQKGQWSTIQQDKEQTSDGLKELIAAISATFTAKDLFSLVKDSISVGDVVGDVVESVPLLGSIVAFAKSAKNGVDIALLAKKAYVFYTYQQSSISLIEVLTLEGIRSYEYKEGARLSVNAVGNATAGAAGLVGLSVVGVVAKRLASIIIQVIFEVLRTLEMRAINKILVYQPGTNPIRLTTEHLEKCPTLCLYLPHLTGVDSFAYLGVLPPSWKEEMHGDLYEAHLTEFVNKGDIELDSWMDALDWTKPNTVYLSPDLEDEKKKGQIVPNPWREDYTRMVKVYKETDRYLFSNKWKLYTPNPGFKGNLVYIPSSVTTKQKATSFFRSMFTKLNSKKKK